MNNNIILKAENISKQYRLGLIGTGTISHDLNRWWSKVRGKEDPFLKIGETNDRSTKGDSQYVWALKDINFEVKRGEVLGIIGKNGAGKSTLLKILSRVTGPTTGSIKSWGRIASLLEVGTGFHPELTGKENVFLNGAILGMTKTEINAKLEEIVEFSGVARYIDTPVKRYSSGMRVRLAFAVAAFLEPDILVVDEVLAVGDAEFQKKAIGKMKDISKGEGRTVLFVSHNMASVQSLCTELLILKNGRVTYEGDVRDGIKEYLGRDNSANNKTGYQLINSNIKGFTFIDIIVKNEDQEPRYSFSYNEAIVVDIKYSIKKRISSFVLLFRIANQEGIVIFTSWDKDSEIVRKELVGKEYIATVIVPSNFLKKGVYDITIAAHTPNVELIDIQENIISFEIDELGYQINTNRSGMVLPKLLWELN